MNDHDWPRADPAALAKFDPATKECTMNCGKHGQDPRSYKELKFMCDDCSEVTPPVEPATAQAPIGWQASHDPDSDRWDAWATCTKEHYEFVKMNPEDWPGYEVRPIFALPPAAPVSAPSQVAAEVVHTDCRSDEGITVGLIDTIINSARLLKGRAVTPAVMSAVEDLLQDKDLRALLATSQAVETPKAGE